MGYEIVISTDLFWLDSGTTTQNGYTQLHELPPDFKTTLHTADAVTTYGYCWSQSVLPGERVSLPVSSAVSSCDVEIVKIGSTETLVGKLENLAVTQ